MVVQDAYKELVMLLGLRHERILSFEGLVLQPDSSVTPKYILFEYAGAGDLNRYLEDLDQPFPLRDFLVLGEDLLSGLKYLAGKKIVHHDLKPANVLVFPEPGGARFKIGDFGLARVLVACKPRPQAGTPLFRAPEVVSHPNEDNVKVDVYSFGVLMLDVAARFMLPSDSRVAYDGLAVDLDKVMHAVREHLRLLGHEDVMRVLEDCVKVDPEARLSAQEALERWNPLFAMFDAPAAPSSSAATPVAAPAPPPAEVRAGRGIEGKFVRSIPVYLPATVSNLGLAVSPEGKYMAVSHGREGKLTVYSLLTAEHPRTLTKIGSRNLGFVTKLCFTLRGHLLVVEHSRNCVLEVAVVTQAHVRTIGEGAIDDTIWSVAANAAFVVVAKAGPTRDRRVLLFHADTGALVRTFGRAGASPGMLAQYCPGIRFTPDNARIILSEGTKDAYRLSEFTLEGGFVRRMGEGLLKCTSDVAFAENGDVVVCEGSEHAVLVLTPDGTAIKLRWGGEGSTDGKFQWPVALAVHDGLLYVLDGNSPRVQVFS